MKQRYSQVREITGTLRSLSEQGNATKSSSMFSLCNIHVIPNIVSCLLSEGGIFLCLVIFILFNPDVQIIVSHLSASAYGLDDYLEDSWSKTWATQYEFLSYLEERALETVKSAVDCKLDKIDKLDEWVTDWSDGFHKVALHRRA